MRTLLILFVFASFARSQDDDRDLRAGGDEQKRYFLHGSTRAKDKPKEGFGLVVVLPGGDGGADFRPFVSNLEKDAVPGGFLVAQPVAVKWHKEQDIVWPTSKHPVPMSKFNTEEFIAAVITDVDKAHGLNAKEIYLVGWSSSGPAVYAAMLGETKAVGAFVAMSVFKPDQLPDLKAAKGKPFYLYHSAEDKVCPFRMAEQAEKDLRKAGAAVKLAKYEGGHGWQGETFTDFRAGIDWLRDNGGK